MTVILRNLPYYDHETALEDLPAQTARLPAILDTGCNHNLVIRHDQLTAWAGVDPSSLRRSGRVRILGREAAQLSANVWLHRNVAGQRELAERPAFLLELTQGIAMLPEAPGDNYPRLPLLGLRALRWAKLRLHVDCGPCRVTLRTRRWLRVFG